MKLDLTPDELARLQADLALLQTIRQFSLFDPKRTLPGTNAVRADYEATSQLIQEITAQIVLEDSLTLR